MARNPAVALISPVAATFDRTVARVLFARSPSSRQKSGAESLGPQERLSALHEIEARYAAHEADPDAFFARGSTADLTQQTVAAYGDAGDVVDLRWRSALVPAVHDDAVVARLAERAHLNEVAVARLFAHRDRPRPTIVLIHGYLGGNFAVEERAFPVRWFFDRGLDVVLATLPHHGLRAVPRRRPLLPASDPRLTIEGFRHAIVDLRGLVAWLRARGAPAVGAMGMSLGGYTTSLLSTVEGLDFAFPMIPLASIADFARDGDRLVGTATQRAEQHEALERALRVVSPISRPSRVPHERMLIIAGKGDRITPLSHAEKLASHFGAKLHVFGGGHLLQVGRDAAFREVGRILGTAGYFAS